MKNSSFYFLTIITLLLAACSAQKNTWTSKAFHNTTSHYNGYYYAREEVKAIEQTILKAQVDDYNRILMLFPSIDSSLAKSYDKEIQEAIKMASIAIERHPNSKWVDDSYILVGKARHYSLDWPNAIQTFKYTNKIGKDKDAKHLAIISLIRTYVDHLEFNNAKAAIDYLEKQKLNRENEKKFLLEKAYYYQLHKDYDNMVRNLTEASPYLKKSDRRGRIYFIIGQVYQKLGFEAEAYNYYKKCISTNPEYEVDFYARLYMAQVTEISRSKDINDARKSFKKLLKDLKNKEFKDKIYYEMGIFELKHKNINEAISNFNRSVREGSNKRIDGEAFLQLGQIYYDTIRNYELSQAYYDSALTSLPPDFENYDQIKSRHEILSEFVKHLKTIKVNDSLLRMASLDSTAIMEKVKVVVDARLKNEAERAAREKKKSNRTSMESDNNSIFDNSNVPTNDITASGSGDKADWYFGNPSAMAVGQTEFIRVWGNIQLADNWRRSSRQQSNVSRNTSETKTTDQKEKKEEKEVTAADLYKVEYDALKKAIPSTEEDKNKALAEIEEAYYHLGSIYYLKLHENNHAAETFITLLNRFPQSSFEPEVLYSLYLIYKDTQPDLAEQYASLLKSKHPNSTFAKILVNPDYLYESGLAAEKQKGHYKVAYEFFENGSYKAADSVIRVAAQEGETSFTPSLELLHILIVGETQDINQYQYELDQFIKKYPDTEVSAYAKTLLESSRTFQEVQQKRKGIQYIKSLNEPHYFVILYKRSDNIDELISTGLDYFNAGHFESLKLTISNLNFNDEFALAFVSELPNVSTAIEYYRTFNENVPNINEFRNQNFDKFVITKDNFDIFYRTKGLDEYLQFFEKNYPNKDE